MDDLARWLGEQLEEDERIARVAGSLSGAATPVGERWRVSGSHADAGGTYWSITTASPDLDRIPVVEMVGSGMSGGGAHTETVAAHIAEWDPARVLREVEAKRQLLADILAEPHATLKPGGSTEIYCAADGGQGEPCDCGRDARVTRYLCLLSLPFKERSGYAEAIASVE